MKDTLERAKSIAKLRAKNDKPTKLSDDHKTRIKALREKFEEIESLFTPTEEKEGPEVAVLADTLLSDSQRLGVDIGD